MCLWDSTLQKPLISGFFFIAASRYTFGNAFEITKTHNETMGERGASACFQRLWDASVSGTISEIGFEKGNSPNRIDVHIVLTDLELSK